MGAAGTVTSKTKQKSKNKRRGLFTIQQCNSNHFQWQTEANNGSSAEEAAEGQKK